MRTSANSAMIRRAIRHGCGATPRSVELGAVLTGIAASRGRWAAFLQGRVPLSGCTITSTESRGYFRLSPKPFSSGISSQMPVSPHTMDGSKGGLTRMPSMTLQSLPQPVVDMQYAVRGRVVIEAHEIDNDLKENPGKYPFKKVTFANIGNPQAVGNDTLTWHRKLLALLASPGLIDEAHGIPYFPKDVIDRARSMMAMMPKPLGPYSHSQGFMPLRKIVANFLTNRDKVLAEPEKIYLTDGASKGVGMMLEMLITGPEDGVMIPIPQYPLYSATLTRMRGQSVPYYLKEEAGWGFDIEELNRAKREAEAKGTNTRALVVVNPGNPTGSVLTRADQVKILEFAREQKLVVIADEVYQENIYADKPFQSMRRVMFEENIHVELLSLHSASKGIYGECGLRGGLAYFDNFDAEVMRQIYKLASVGLCSNTSGQFVMALICDPPKPSDASYDQFCGERDGILASLKRKAKIVENKLNQMKNVVCQPAEGAMYCFPRIILSKAAIEEAQSQKIEPDMLYCLEMLHATGVVTVPGSGFGQVPGTYHYRITLLPREEDLPEVMNLVHTFNENFHAKYP
eukprot:GHVU01069372.1.p1 GENE.GHVU01069372.1~~GHVU01069372.1.p1  ORF type:complete len:572 (-),score=95.57 GHVU01069372.1:75-1790(-)